MDLIADSELWGGSIVLPVSGMIYNQSHSIVADGLVESVVRTQPVLVAT